MLPHPLDAGRSLSVDPTICFTRPCTPAAPGGRGSISCCWGQGAACHDLCGTQRYLVNVYAWPELDAQALLAGAGNVQPARSVHFWLGTGQRVLCDSLDQNKGMADNWFASELAVHNSHNCLRFKLTAAVAPNAIKTVHSCQHQSAAPHRRLGQPALLALAQRSGLPPSPHNKSPLFASAQRATKHGA